jgi:hypothetical protein
MDILQVISVIIAFSALIVTIVIAWIQRRRKEIAYEVISNTLVIPELEEVSPHTTGILHVLFNGKPVKGARLVILKVWNTGNEPIDILDYAEPITFNFGEKAEVLNVAILETSKGLAKSNAEKALDISSNKVILKPILLNHHASITLKVLLLGFDGKINTDETSIKGVQYMLEVNTAERSSQRLKIAVMATTFLVLILLALSLILSFTQFRFVQSNTMLSMSMNFSIVALALVIILIILWMWLQNRVVFTSSSIEK